MKTDSAPKIKVSKIKLTLKTLLFLCLFASFVFSPIPINAQELEDPEFINHSVPSILYQSHVQNIGWQDWAKNGDMSGSQGRGLRLEGINIKLDGQQGLGLRYKTHVQNIGWQAWVNDNELSGTEGRSLRLEAICIELSGENSELFDLYYQVHAQNIGWMGWAKNGQESGSAGYGYRLEAINIVIVEAGAPAPGPTDNRFAEPSQVEQVLNKINGSWLFIHGQDRYVMEVTKTSPSTGHFYWIEYVGGGDSMEFDFKINSINADGTAILIMDMTSLRTYGIVPGFSEIPIDPLMDQPNAMIYFQTLFHRQ